MTRHRLYRNVFDPETIPAALACLWLSWINLGFEDRLDLQSGTYYYSLVMLDANGVETSARSPSRFT